MMKLSVVLIAAGALALAGCTGNAKPAPSSAPSSPASSPSRASGAPTGALTFHNGALLVNENFKDNHQRWAILKDADVSLHFIPWVDGHTEYGMTILKKSMSVHPNPELRGLTPAQITNSVVAASYSTSLYVSQETQFGVTCRAYQGNRYEFVIQRKTDGTEDWGIIKHTAENGKLLAHGRTSEKSSTISGACVGGGVSGPAHLGMSVGDTLVGQVDDPQPFRLGYSGLFAYTASTDKIIGSRLTFNVSNWQLHAATVS
jgi:hypothetical protein